MSDASGVDGSQSSEAPERVAVDEFRIAADLVATVGEERLRVRTVDGRIEVAADGFDALRELRSLREALPTAADDVLDRLPLGRVPVGVSVAGVEVARIDPGVPAGPLSRALGLAPVGVDLRGVVRALVRARRRE